MQSKNLFADLPESLPTELTEILARSPAVRIERIVSTGQSTAKDFWYDQEEHEWVAVLKGEARLLFESESNAVLLQPGDHVLIPAHQKHRVEWTSDREPTVWLAVFFDADA